MRNPRLRGSSVTAARHTLLFHLSVSPSTAPQILCAENTDQYMFFFPPSLRNTNNVKHAHTLQPRVSEQYSIISLD